MRLVFALAALLTLPVSAFALDIPSVAELGAEPEKLAQIVGDSKVILLHKPRPISWKDGKKTIKRNERYVTGLTVIAAPVTTVRQTVADFAQYVKYMPQTETADVKQGANGKTVVDYELEFEMPVMNIGVDYTLEYTNEPNGDITWSLVEGDMDQNVGRYEFYPLPGDKTLLAYTNWNDIKGMGFGVKVLLDAQPDLQVAIPVASAAVILNAIQRRAEGLPLKPAKPKSVERKTPSIPMLSKGTPAIPLPTMRKLANAGTVVFVHPEQWIMTDEGPKDFVFVSAATLVKKPRDVVRKYALMFDRYGEFFSQVSKVKATPVGDDITVDWRLKLGFGVLAVPIDYTLAYKRLQADDPNVMTFDRVKGDIRFIFGSWEFMEPAPDETLVFYSTASELGDKASAILKLGNLVPNRQITIGVSSAAIILENLSPWVEKQP